LNQNPLKLDYKEYFILQLMDLDILLGEIIICGKTSENALDMQL